MSANKPPQSRGPGKIPPVCSRPLKVLIVDDHPLLAEGLQGLLSLQPDLAVVGAVGTGAEALEALSTHRPDLVLLDWLLPDTTGPEIIKQILAHSPGTKILVYTGHPDDAVTLAALRAGAQGCLSKAEPLEKLLRAIRAVAEGEIWADRHAVARYLQELRARVPDPVDNLSADLPALTPREQEVAWLAAQGDSNKEIAERLGIGELTVKSHLRSLFKKLGVANRTQLALRLLQQERRAHR